MEGLGSDLDSLLRYPSGPRPLVLDILKGKGSLIEVVRCSENGLILLKEVEHTPDHKANVTQGGRVAWPSGAVSSFNTSSCTVPNNISRAGERGNGTGASAMGATPGLSASALKQASIPASSRIRPCRCPYIAC